MQNGAELIYTVLRMQYIQDSMLIKHNYFGHFDSGHVLCLVVTA